MPKIAILQGNRLSSWHMEMYARLNSKYELTAFVPPDNIFPLDEIPIPYKVIPYENETGSLLHRKQINLKYRREHSSHGFEIPMAGLDDALAEFDLIHTWETFTHWTESALKAKRKYGVPVLVTVWDNIPFDAETLEIPASIKKRALDESDSFLVYTRVSRKMLRLEGITPGRLKTVLPGVDIEKFRYRKPNPKIIEELEIEPDDGIILYVGRLVWEKGIFDLIHAIAELNRYDKTGKLKLLVVGEGPIKKELAARAEKCRVSVQFLGKKEYKDLPDIYNCSNIIAAPSIPTKIWQEQFCMALIEGMACGLPGIVSTSGGLPEILGEGGISVPPQDYISLAEAIEKILGNKETYLKYSKLARERVEEVFNVDSNAEIMENIYSELSR